MDDKELHARFTEYGQNAREWLKKCALLLPEIERRRIWKKRGFDSIYEYAAKLAGMSQWQVTDALRVLKKIEDKPALQRIAEEKGIGSVRPVTTIATKETDAFWAEKAKNMSKNTLEIYVKNYKEEFGPRTILKPEKVSLNVQISPKLLQKLEKMKGEASWEEFLEELSNLKKPTPVKNKSRYVPVAIRRHVLQRTNGKCAFPSCNKPYDSLHHTKRFALDKTHDPDTLVPLCKAHERIAHLGLIENEEFLPEVWHLRKKPDLTDPKSWIDQMVWLRR